MRKPEPGTQAAVTPIAFVRAISQAYAHYGRPFGPALIAAHIAPHLLENDAARVTAEQFEALNLHAMRELDDEALGWFSRPMRWGSLGLLCRAAISAPDLGVALKRWCRCHGLIVDDIRITLSRREGTASITIEEQAIRQGMREFCLVSTLRAVHGFACWLVDSRIPFSDLSFAFSRPEHASSYRAMFPGEARFDAAQTGFSFNADYLTLPPMRDEAATRAMLQNALRLMVLQYRRDRLLVERVRMQFRARLAANATSLPNAEELAESLNISRRSLHRQLQEEGSSLQQIKDDIRRERALQLIGRSNRPLKQVAHMAGFRNEKSFSRAFRQWTGQSPGEMRRERKP
ncbi:AraC family transcriptional regulator [Xanthobacter sp. TB0139]|uniref:AraC family transcriptional regulator n=1 Tax=Xanthobacter sp. TB0139 TaxID=3459178 RepID=UPI00403A6EB7